MNTKRDKFLTEAMGECWHDYVKTCGCCPATCAKCGADEGYTENNDFSTWHDFGKLLNSPKSYGGRKTKLPIWAQDFHAVTV